MVIRKTFLIALVIAAVIGASVAAVWMWRETGTRSRHVVAANVSADGNASDDEVETLDVDWIIPANEIEAYKQQALAGSNVRAHALANHYRELRQPEARRRWLTLAANRGDCAAMSLLHGAAIDARDSAGRSHWNEMLRRNACTWGKTYGTESTPNRPAGDMPLWDDR